MNSHRLMIRILVFASLALHPIVEAHAQAPKKTVAILSLASIDTLLGNIQYLADTAGTGDTGRMVSMMARQYAQGLNSQKPVGFVLRTDGQEFEPLGFIPVTDLKSTLSLLEQQLGAPRDAGDGILELPGPQPVFVKEQNGWAYVGQTIESLGIVPPNPNESLSGLEKQYDIALRANVRNIPQHFRDMAITTLKQGVQQGLQQLPEEDDEDYELRQNLVKVQMEQIDAFVNESDQITLGWKTDPTKKRTFLDMTLTALPGTKTARQFSMLTDTKSDFAGFLLPGAAVTMNSTGRISPDQIDQSVAMLGNLRQTALKELEKEDSLADPAARQAANELLGGAMDILMATIKTGKMDGGAALMLRPNTMTLLAGLSVADGSEVEKIVRRLAMLAQDKPDFPVIKFNADRQADVAFHTMTVPIPEGEDAREVLGENLDVAIGIGRKSAYLGLGADCLTAMKKAITSSAVTPQKDVPPFQLNLALTPIMEFASSIEENPLLLTVVDALKEGRGNDHLLLRGTTVENGVTYRLEFEEGIVRAAGRAATMASAGGF